MLTKTLRFAGLTLTALIITGCVETATGPSTTPSTGRGADELSTKTTTVAARNPVDTRVASANVNQVSVNSGAATTQVNGLRVVPSLPAPLNSSGGQDQLLLVGDILEIDVFQVDQLDKTVQIDSRGFVSMPLIGQVQATGKTVSNFELELERLYGVNYLQSPEITVLVKESVGQQVTMDGEFLAPGIYPTNPGTTLLQAVAQARGLSTLADEKKVFVYRDFQGEKVVANFNLADIRAGKISDPRIFGGDVVVAFKSQAKVAAENLKAALGIAVNASRAAAPF